MRSNGNDAGMLKGRKSANDPSSASQSPFSLHSGSDRGKMLDMLEHSPLHHHPSPSRSSASSGHQQISMPIPISGSPRLQRPLHGRACRLSSVPLVQLQSHGGHDSGGSDEEHLRTSSFPQSSTRRRSATGSVGSSDPGGLAFNPLTKGGMCSVSDTMESLRGGLSPSHGGPPVLGPHQGHVRIKHLTRSQEGSSRFPKLDECAHFHYENVELGPVKVCLSEERCGVEGGPAGKAYMGNNGADKENEGGAVFFVQVTSNRRTFTVRRTYDNFRMFDRQLHRCVYDRKYSLLEEMPPLDSVTDNEADREEALRSALTAYLDRFSQLAGSLINCGTVLNWLELDNRGHRLIVTDEAAINTPAVAAAYVVKRYRAQASDEISFEVGDMVSVIDMPPPDESSWWRGKKGFEVGFFPCECVEIIGEKVPQLIKVPKTSSKPVLRKHGKLIAFFRSFLLSRPSRRKLKQSGILKERVFGCDLGEHLMNTGRDIPLVLKSCTEFIEAYGIVDGIYRLSGVTSNIQKLRLAFDEDRVPDLVEEAIIQDIHCVASLLKMYFRELPNPLLTYQLYDKFVRAVQSEDEVRLLRLRDIVQQLPPPHYRTLEYLIRHLARVAAHGHQTGMTPRNVAIVWAPNLLRSKDLEGCGVGALHVVGVQAVLTEYLIRYADLLFSEKMPLFQSPDLGSDTPRRTRPKSLAISTPTKLLTLEEARSRAVAANLPQSHQKYIDVGGGPDKLPPKYHTVIDLPLGKRGGSAKLKKSPSGWKSLFSRGTGRDKERSGRKVSSPRKVSAGSLQYPSLPMQYEKGSLDTPGAHVNVKKLRTVKSAESLVSLGGGTSCRSSRALDSSSPLEFSKLSWPPCDFPALECITSSNLISPPKSPSNHKHMRSVSHDSYFELLEQETNEHDDEDDDEDNENDDEMDEDKGFQLYKEVEEQINRNQELRALEFGTLLGGSLDKVCQSEFNSPKEEDTKECTAKVTRKQKLHSSDSDVGSPKVQKMSKKFRQMSGSSSEESKSQDCETTQNERPMDVTQGMEGNGYLPPDPAQPSEETEPEKHCHTVVERYGNESTIIVEVHATQEVSSSDEEGRERRSHRNSMVIGEMRLPPHRECSLEDSEGGNSLSVDVTVSDSVSTSQLRSFEAGEQLVLSENYYHEDRNFFSPSGMDTSLETPDSPTMANISEMPSSGSDVSDGSDEDRLKDFEQPVVQNFINTSEEQTKSSQSTENQSTHLYVEVASKERVDLGGNGLEEIHIEGRIETSTMDYDLKKNVELDLDTTAKCVEESPSDIPRATMSPCRPDLAAVLALATHYIDTSDSSTGSIGGVSTRQPSDVVRNSRRKSSGVTVGERTPPQPLSPVEDSRRKFESEIGRSLIRDHQMRLEMEQIQMEGRERASVKPPISPQDKSKNVSSPTQKQLTPSHIEEEAPVELRRPLLPTLEMDSDRKRNGESPQRPKSCHQYSQPAEEQKRLSEPTSPVPKYLLSEMKSVKQMLCKFENPDPLIESVFTSPVSTTSSRKSVSSLEDSTSASKQKQQPSLFTQLKVLKLQGLQSSPQSGEMAKTDPWSDPILDLMEESESYQKVLPLVASPQEAQKQEFKERVTHVERPATLDIGNKATPLMSCSACSSQCQSSSSPLEASQDHPTSNGTVSNPCSPILASVEQFQEEEDEQVLLSSPVPDILDGTGGLATPTDQEPLAEESEATRRERIDKYKEERRAQLREKLRSESFRVEAEEKEKVQSEFRVRKGSGSGSGNGGGSGGGPKVSSPSGNSECQQTRRRSLSPHKKGDKGKSVSESDRSKSSPGTPVLEVTLDCISSNSVQLTPAKEEKRPVWKSNQKVSPSSPSAKDQQVKCQLAKAATPKGIRERAAIFECTPRQASPSQRVGRTPRH